MTVLNDVRIAFTDLVAAELPGVDVVPYPLVVGELPDEVIYVESSKSVFTWRSLGPAPNNRTETIKLHIVVRVYREGATQRAAAAAAVDRCEELLAGIEAAVVSDATPFQIGGTVSFGRIAAWKIAPVSEPPGWTATGRARLEAKQRSA